MKKFLLSLACVLGLGAWANATEVTFDLTNPTAYGYEEPAANDGVVFVAPITVEGITLSVDNGADAESLSENQKLRFFKNQAGTSIDFRTSSAGGKKAQKFILTSSAENITSIAFTSSSFNVTADPEGLTDKTWTGDAKSVTFTTTEKVIITKIVVTYGESSNEGGEQGGTDDPVVTPETPAVNSVADFVSSATDGSTYIVNFALTVGYANGASAFATDGKDFIQIYKYDNGLKAGDVIPAGWEATYTVYYSAPELKPTDVLPAVTAGSFEPKEVELADITTANVNQVIKIKNVTFAEATPSAKSNFTGTNGEASLTFRNNYIIDSVEAGTYDVEAVIAIYSGNAQAYPISYTKSETTSVSDINVENGAVEYFNLQGVRVANPTNGIFVRRQGNKVSKVVIR
jgi:hypothetical protein